MDWQEKVVQGGGGRARKGGWWCCWNVGKGGCEGAPSPGWVPISVGSDAELKS